MVIKMIKSFNLKQINSYIDEMHCEGIYDFNESLDIELYQNSIIRVEEKANSIINSLKSRPLDLYFTKDEKNLNSMNFKLDSNNIIQIEKNDGIIIKRYSLFNNLNSENYISFDLKSKEVYSWLSEEDFYYKKMKGIKNDTYNYNLYKKILNDYSKKLNEALNFMFEDDLLLNIQRLNQFIHKNKLYKKGIKNNINLLAENKDCIDIKNFQEYEDILCIKYDYLKSTLPKSIQKKLSIK